MERNLPFTYRKPAIRWLDYARRSWQRLGHLKIICSISSPSYGMNLEGITARFLSIEEGDTKRKSFKRLHRWRYSPTAAYGHNEVHLHPYKPRRLSVAEALAIQSLPRQFELPPDMTLTNMFQSVGNGVPFLASKMAARSIKEFLLSRTTDVDI